MTQRRIFISRITGESNRQGAILLLVAVTMLGLMSLLALAIDGGNLQHEKRLAQTAADAGALAGAQEIYRKNASATIVASAKAESQRNGFQDGVGGNVVTVTYPATGTYSGNAFVDVVVERSVATRIARFFGNNARTVRARATGGLALAESCFIVLRPSGAPALELKNSSTLQGSGCGIQVNSPTTNAVKCSGQGTITSPSMGVVATTIDCSGAPASLQTGAPPMQDPGLRLVMPTIPNTCDYGSATSAANLSGTITLSPGTYCGGINVNGNFTLSQGLYILRGGGLKATGGGAEIHSSGTGVTIVNTAPPAGASYSWGPINVQSGSVVVDLGANTDPTSALPGVLFYTDPAAPYMDNLFKASSVARMDGTMYFPTGKVSFESGASFTINGALIAYEVALSQSGNVTFTGYGGGTSYLALQRPTVVQ